MAWNSDGIESPSLHGGNATLASITLFEGVDTVWRINSKGQVIGLDHQPGKGLYAEGEGVGGVHGACRLAGCAIVDCLVFRGIAGRNAAAEDSWEWGREAQTVTIYSFL